MWNIPSCTEVEKFFIAAVKSVKSNIRSGMLLQAQEYFCLLKANDQQQPLSRAKLKSRCWVASATYGTTLEVVELPALAPRAALLCAIWNIH